MKRLTTTLCLALALCGGAFAQDGDEMRAKELQAKIKKQMTEIDLILLSAEKSSPKDAADKMADVKKSLEEMLKDAQTKQSQVVSDIEELVRMAKLKQSQSGQGQSGSPPPPKGGGQKPSPERPRDPDSEELKKQGQNKPNEQDGKQNEDGQKPEGGGPDDQKDKAEDGKGVPPPDDKATFEREDTAGRWGTLPGKVEELLKQLSADQFPERYKKLIEQYYRRSQKARSN